MHPLVAFVLLSLCAGVVAAHDIPQPRQISVEGQAERLLEPDIARLSISVQGRASSPEGAMNQAGDNARTVIDALSKLTPARHLRATDTQLRQVVKGTERHWRRDSSEPMEMLATRNVQVERLDIDKLPEAMRALSRLPLARIDRVSTTFEKADEVVDELTLLALDDAKLRARQMAERLGVRLGLPLSVSSHGSAPAQPQFAVRALAMESADAGGGFEATGQERIEARVQVSFELEAP